MEEDKKNKLSNGEAFIVSRETAQKMLQIISATPTEFDEKDFEISFQNGKSFLRLRKKKKREVPTGLVGGDLPPPWQTVISRTKNATQGAQITVTKGTLTDDNGNEIVVAGLDEAKDVTPTPSSPVYVYLELTIAQDASISTAEIKVGGTWANHPQPHEFDQTEPYRQTKYRKVLAKIEGKPPIAPATEPTTELTLAHTGGNLQLITGYIYGRLAKMIITT